MLKRRTIKKKKKQKLKKCPQCGIYLAKKLKICFNCNHVFLEKKKKSKHI